MEKLSFKSCFIFNPNLKSLLKKPSDDEKQDAKLLIYYPSCEEILIKRSNMGIIGMKYDSSLKRLQTSVNERFDVEDSLPYVFNACEIVFEDNVAKSINRISFEYTDNEDDPSED